MPDLDPAALNLRPLSSIDDLANDVGYSTDRIRRCLNPDPAKRGKWPPLVAKRMPDGQLRITAAAAAEWINQLPDA